jgi:hypothetical protein
MTILTISLVVSLFSTGAHAQLIKASPTSQATCDRTLKSPECKAVYAEMLSFNVTPKKLVCTDLQDRIRSFETSATFARNCAQGGWNAFQNGGIAIVEVASATTAPIDFVDKEDDACNAELTKRRAIFTDYNISVPAILRLDIPTETQLTNMRCLALRGLFRAWREQKNAEVIKRVERKNGNGLLPSEQEFVNYRNSLKDPASNIIELAKNRLDDLGIQQECYTAKAAAELICEAAAELGTSLAGPAAIAFKADKVQRIYRVAGIARKVTVSAKNDEALALLEKNAALAGPERIVEAEKVLGRTFTPAEKNAVTLAYEVAAGTGRGFTITEKGELDSSGYAEADLTDKNKILREAGFSQGQRDLLLRQGIVGVVGNSTKLKETANQLRARAESAEASGSVEAYNQAAKAFEDYLRVAKDISESDYAIAADVNTRAEKYEKSAEYFLRSKGKANSPKRTTEVVNGLVQEKDKLNKLKKESPEDKKIQKNYTDHLKMISALIKMPSFNVNESTKMYLLKP